MAECRVKQAVKTIRYWLDAGNEEMFRYFLQVRYQNYSQAFPCMTASAPDGIQHSPHCLAGMVGVDEESGDSQLDEWIARCCEGDMYDSIKPPISHCAPGANWEDVATLDLPAILMHWRLSLDIHGSPANRPPSFIKGYEIKEPYHK